MSIFKTSKTISDQNQLLESASSLYNSIEPLEEGVIKYTPSMVPVHARETVEGTKYLVESDMLNKLDMPIVEAFNAVCESNDIDPEDTYVAVPDDEDIVADIAESAYVESQVASDVYDTKSLIEAGINILSYEPILEFGVSKDVKMVWKQRKDCSTDDEKSNSFKDIKIHQKISKTIIDKMTSAAKTAADWKFIKKKLAAMKTEQTAIEGYEKYVSYFEDMAEKCDEKIAELKNKSKNNDGEE